MRLALPCRIAAAVAAMLSLLPAAGAYAQGYPNKPIRFVVPLAAGGGTDILARTMAQKMSEDLGQPVLVDNKPGGGTVIGAEFVAKSAADGYTIFVSAPAIVTNHSLYEKLPYDALRDFVAITQWVSFANLLVVNPSVPVQSVKDLIALARSSPGKVSYGSAGNGSTTHLGMELFKAMAGISMVHIPYKGSTPAMSDLLGGRVSVMFDAAATSMPHIKSGKLRVLAVSSATRSALLPDLPTIAEAGVPGYDSAVWIGMFAPTGTPREAIDRLHAASSKVLAMPDVRERLAGLGFEPVGSSQEQFAALVRSELVKWSKVIKESGAKVD